MGSRVRLTLTKKRGAGLFNTAAYQCPSVALKSESAGRGLEYWWCLWHLGTSDRAAQWSWERISNTVQMQVNTIPFFLHMVDGICFFFTVLVNLNWIQTILDLTFVPSDNWVSPNSYNLIWSLISCGEYLNSLMGTGLGNLLTLLSWVILNESGPPNYQNPHESEPL